MFRIGKKLIAHSLTLLHRLPAILNKPKKERRGDHNEIRVHLILRDGWRGPETQELSFVVWERL